MVQVKSKDSVDDLVQYCVSNFGGLKKLYFHHNENNEAFANFFICEFDNEETVNEIVTNHAKHRVDTVDHFPVYSPILWLCNGNAGQKRSSNPNIPIILPPDDKNLKDKNALTDFLKTFDTVSANSHIILLIIEIFIFYIVHSLMNKLWPFSIPAR